MNPQVHSPKNNFQKLELIISYGPPVSDLETMSIPFQDKRSTDKQEYQLK